MKSIAIDFQNHIVCIMTAGQQGTESNLNLKKGDFASFIPEKLMSYSSFTWDFENETFSVNQEYKLLDGCIMTKDCFIPELIVPMPKLSNRYDEFLAIMGYEEVESCASIFEEVLKILGLEWENE